MNGLASNKNVLIGAALVVLYTLISAASDAAAKFISLDFAAPQLFALSGGLVALFSVLAAGRKGNLQELRTSQPLPIFWRSVMTVVSAVLFFYAMRALPLAEVFVFVGLMPIMAALLTPLILKERVDASAWVILLLGFVGVLCLFPEGVAGISTAHIVAFFASLTGVVSLVIARLVGKREKRPLALVFYPYFAMFAVMSVALPFVYQPMSYTEFGVAIVYSLFLFFGRYLLVRALTLAPTHVVMPVMNLQFLWMVALGGVFFAERPGLHVIIGAIVVIGSCIALVRLGSVEQTQAPQKLLQNAATMPRQPISRNSYRSRKSLSRSGSRSRSAHRSVRP